MPVDKKDLEKQAWIWTSITNPNKISKIHLENAYRIGPSIKICKTCKKNCTSNPRCLTGLGEEAYLKSQPIKVDALESSLKELRNPFDYVGLVNLGATCYVNSLIQVWFHNEDMRKIIFKWNIEDDPDEQLGILKEERNNQPYSPVTALGQLQYIFAMMQFGNHKYLDPVNLASALGLDLTTQQDVQEFSKLLLCHIEGKFQTNDELTNKLRILTQGQYSYINCCKTCGTEHKTSTTFYELDLQLAPTLNEAIHKYLIEEQLAGLNQYHCTTCNSKQDATRFIRLDSLPDTLNIQLLRFLFQRQSGRKKKISTSIQFPEELDMSEYMKCSPQTHIFTLVAVLNHKGGSAHSGHFSANIRNSDGDWFEFSDDKVEKMQSKRIEDDTVQENGKGGKRGRIPKGFFVSNTAYMLVYKRTFLCADNLKKSSLKKLQPFNHIDSQISSETLTRDSVTTTIKGKRVIKNCPDKDQGILDKRKKIENYYEHRTNCPDKENSNNELHFQSLENHVSKVNIDKEKQRNTSTFDGKIDFMNMSCNEKDAYENAEFEKWGLSSKMRCIVHRDNKAHELKLLAQYQAKQRDLEKYNEKRQLVFDFYEAISIENESTEYRWIPTDWLMNWLKGSRKVEYDWSKIVPPVDCSVLMCLHRKLDPLKVNKAKYIPLIAATLLFSKYGSDNQLTENSFCEFCVKKQCQKLRFKENLEKDYKELTDILKNVKQLPIIDGYLVGSESLRYWKSMATKEFLLEIDNVPFEETEDEEEGWTFNEDLLCDHNNLRTFDSKVKIVPREVWIILKKYFKGCNEYSSSVSTCSICTQNEELAKKTKEFDKINAKHQKDQLLDLYYERNRQKVLEALKFGNTCYIVERGFLDLWRLFIRYAENFSKPPPTRIENAKLICQNHKCFLYQAQSSNTKEYSIISADEWNKLLSFYSVDHTIKLMKMHGLEDYCTEPETCTACMFERLQQEQEKSFKYEKATIYVKRLEENELTNISVETSESFIVGSNRPVRRGRKVKGSHELIVSSENTLKEVKLMTMQIYKAGPFDQHIMLGEHELTDDEQTLSALGILPGTLLTLKIDMPAENSDCDFDIAGQDYMSPEKGFKGTELAG